ncbi:MAG: FKBP-type peptidyl-prolyl cis-trans isomerase [Candidatus Stygibacter australis]|nr:FKBP-type peptidyl-prolyl cis-trans isomerase [Candidatus Stygibacter australis]
MKKGQIILTLLFLVLSLCLSGDDMYKDFIKTDSGLMYQITTQGEGKLAKAGDTVVMHYTGKFENGDVFDSSIDRGKPFVFPLGAGRVIKGWDEGVAYLHVGDKATFIIPPEIGYGSMKNGDIPANSTLIFDVELLDIKSKNIKSIPPYDVTGLELHTTDSGLQYYIVDAGAGDSPNQGSNVEVHYTGYLQSNNQMFDSSVQKGKPFRFQLGAGRVIKGWDEGVALMKIGAKYRFIIPPELGYGNRNVGPIPAGSALIFDVELIDFN